jgi:ATP-dependent exoDNAse (exonuclease V) beta subunit
MPAMNKALRGDAARHDAISVHDRSILVEAGAGSGKTAVMVGCVAAMLAEGIAPNSFAAVTFTELAASELLFRVREFVGELAAGNVPPELRIAFTTGLSDGHKANLASASAAKRSETAGRDCRSLDVVHYRFIRKCVAQRSRR